MLSAPDWLRDSALPTAVIALFAAASPTWAQWPPDSLENLQVLPPDISVQELIRTMMGFTQALGVQCTYCHVGRESIPLAEYDFASDEKPAKHKARVMIEMLDRINNVHLASLEERASPPVTVECVTCHRSTIRPRMLEDILIGAFDTGGIDSVFTTYHRLRAARYGSFAWDFTERPLIEVAGHVAATSAMTDAIRILELNVEMNPEASFARIQLMTLSLNHTFRSDGSDAGRQAYAAFRERFGAAAIPEQLLNTVGYSLLRAGITDAAVAAFELNAEAYPQSWNVHDSLGEGLAAKGDVEAAIRAYERSLQLNPDNANAVAKLRELRGRADPMSSGIAHRPAASGPSIR